MFVSYESARFYYNNAYYINFGRYGNSNPQTEYFKLKVSNMKDLIKAVQEIKRSNIGKNLSKNSYKVQENNKENQNQLVINSKTISEIEGFYNNNYFKIVITNSFEPFMITFRLKNKEVQTLYFEKSGLFRFLNLKGSDMNSELYSHDLIFE